MFCSISTIWVSYATLTHVLIEWWKITEHYTHKIWRLDLALDHTVNKVWQLFRTLLQTHAYLIRFWYGPKLVQAWNKNDNPAAWKFKVFFFQSNQTFNFILFSWRVFSFSKLEWIWNFHKNKMIWSIQEILQVECLIVRNFKSNLFTKKSNYYRTAIMNCHYAL